MKILKMFLQGIAGSVFCGIIGALIGFVLDIQLLKASYILIIVVGMLFLLISSKNLVGTPKQRKKFFTGVENVDGKMKYTKPEDRKPLGHEGLKPGIIGAVMVFSGFFLEWLMH